MLVQSFSLIYGTVLAASPCLAAVCSTLTPATADPAKFDGAHAFRRSSRRRRTPAESINSSVPPISTSVVAISCPANFNHRAKAVVAKRLAVRDARATGVGGHEGGPGTGVAVVVAVQLVVGVDGDGHAGAAGASVVSTVIRRRRCAGGPQGAGDASVHCQDDEQGQQVPQGEMTRVVSGLQHQVYEMYR